MSSAGDETRSDFIRDEIRSDLAAGRFDGQVQTRFPPEPNGFLHIGHAKAICLAFTLAEEFGGVCKLRFDDTNPETEEAHYAQAIIDDITWLGFVPDGEVLHASDYFDTLYGWAEHLISNGLAYVDDQDAETISAQRGGFTTPGTPSPFRDRSVAENLELFRGMRAGEFPAGSRVLRARIDMNHENMQMRDPVMYRIRDGHHFRTGNQWPIYPTYDWAHGQSDAIEGTTHSICTLEFDTHRPLYDWFLDHLPLPGHQPRQIEFARLNLTHTVTSKRKLRQLVDEAHVEGWDDPRMPTLGGLRRRGYPPESIVDFCAHIGVGRVDGTHEIELLEWFVRNELNRSAQRRMAVLRPVEVIVDNWPDDTVEWREAVNNPENPDDGTRQIPFSGRLLIDRDDVMVDPPPKYYRLAPGREVRLRAGYFLRCHEVDTDDSGAIVRVHATYDPETGGGHAPDGRKVKATITWLSAAEALPATVALYERLFTAAHPGENTGDPLDDLHPRSRELLTEARVEAAALDAAPGEVIQFERLGYFAHDLDRPGLFHRTVGLRDEWARLQQRRG